MNKTASAAMNAPAKNRKVAKKSKGKTPKVISRLKASGLSRLLGKISKRAAKRATFVRGQGQTPDHQNLGRSMASVGGVSGVAGRKPGSIGKTFKVGGVGTIGKGGASLKGIGSLKGGHVGNASVGILDEETEIQGGLDRDVISRVIQSKLGQIRYCYERQLSASPDLYGKVLIKFTIGHQGSVVTQNVGLTTLNSAMVEGCILRRVASWKFPKPKGGTPVFVTYPFLFKSTN